MKLELLNLVTTITPFAFFGIATWAFLNYVFEHDFAIQRLKEEQRGLARKHPPQSKPGTYVRCLPAGPVGLVVPLPTHINIHTMEEYVVDPLADAGSREFARAWLAIERELQQRNQRINLVGTVTPSSLVGLGLASLVMSYLSYGS